MATERDYQGLYDRIAALRETVAGRLSSDLISNPQLADALVKQIDDLLTSAAAAARQGARPARRARPGGGAGAGRHADPAGRPAVRRDRHLRADHRRRRPVLHLPAREDRRLPRRAEAPGA